MKMLAVTDHVVERAGRRNLSPRDIAFVLHHGRTLYRTGIKFYFLGWRDIPAELRRVSHIARLEGVTILVGHDGALITAYKNPKALRRIKRKPKQGFIRQAA